MVEINTKYKIGTRRFGFINWIGAWTLYKKEVLRFLVVWIQTIISPVITSVLFLLVLSVAVDNYRGEVLSVNFVNFLAPGLIAMQLIQQSFSHSSSTFLMSKIQGNIVDILYAPLSSLEVTMAISLAAITRSMMIIVISIIFFSITIDMKILNFINLIVFSILSASIMASIGIISGLWAEKFDHMATITNFIIVPLSFLSGTFYSIEKLPMFLQTISKINPFFYMIDGFRYSFIGQSDGSIEFGILYLTSLSIIIWFIGNSCKPCYC